MENLICHLYFFSLYPILILFLSAGIYFFFLMNLSLRAWTVLQWSLKSFLHIFVLQVLKLTDIHLILPFLYLQTDIMRETTAIYSRKKSNSWSEMCGKETKGSRWCRSSPGTGEVVLKWYFLVGRWLSGKGIWGGLLLSLCSSGDLVSLLRHIWIFRIHPSPGENIQNQGTLLLNYFQFIRSG